MWIFWLSARAQPRARLLVHANNFFRGRRYSWIIWSLFQPKKKHFYAEISLDYCFFTPKWWKHVDHQIVDVKNIICLHVLRTFSYKWESFVVCSLKIFFQKIYLGIDRRNHSEQLFALELLLKMRSYLSGNRRIFGKMSDIFAHKPYF